MSVKSKNSHVTNHVESSFTIESEIQAVKRRELSLSTQVHTCILQKN